MRVCIATLGENLESLVDPRFGRCQYLLILDEQGNLIKGVPNPGVRAGRGAGIAAAQEVTSQQADVLITGNIGPNAFSVLKMTGIRIFSVPFGASARDAFEMWQKNKLSELKAPLGPPSGAPGFGRGLGRRRGRDRGRNW